MRPAAFLAELIPRVPPAPPPIGDVSNRGTFQACPQNSVVAWERLDHGQIARMLGVSRNAVRIRLYRARKRLEREPVAAPWPRPKVRRRLVVGFAALAKPTAVAVGTGLVGGPA